MFSLFLLHFETALVNKMDAKIDGATSVSSVLEVSSVTKSTLKKAAPFKGKECK